MCFQLCGVDPLEVILGHRPSSLQREFLSAPIHSPPSLVAISVLQLVSEPVAVLLVMLATLVANVASLLLASRSSWRPL